MHYGHKYEQLTLLFKEADTYRAWVVGLQVALRTCGRKDAMERALHEALLEAYKAHRSKEIVKGTTRQLLIT